jgi:hypothetical protein
VEFQNHDGNDNGKNAVAKSFQSSFIHTVICMKINIFYRREVLVRE